MSAPLLAPACHTPSHLSEPLLHTLHPGDMACGGRGERFATLLGSCVAVVLSDPRRTVGAMCHVVHAGFPPRGDVQTHDTAWGEPALQGLYALLRQRGIVPQLCEAWLYGGGNMFPGQFPNDRPGQATGAQGGGHVGTQNARWAQQALARDGLRLLHQDLGGSCYRRLAWTVGPHAPEVQAVPV